MPITSVTVTKKDDFHANQYVSACSAIESLSIEEALSRIINLTEGLVYFWKDAKGWAPIEAADLLSKSRLDRQASLTHCLKMWAEEKNDALKSGSLILAWANLGALVEGSMKLFLSVWYNDYKNDVDAIKKKKNVQSPDGVMLGQLRLFFKKKIWGEGWDNWVQKIQHNRNAIHAYKDKNIGSHEDFLDSIKEYLNFLRYINFRLPYPDEIYEPREF